jgi:hypothetical protein
VRQNRPAVLATAVILFAIVAGCVTTPDGTDVTDPMSRHNLHVTGESDLIAIGPWSSEQLYAAVERADAEDGIVVLDYGREQLYLLDADDVRYLPPTALGFGDSSGLELHQPRQYDPETGNLGRVRVDSLTVAPEFDILVPAFDWTEPDEHWEPPELTYQERPSDSPSGAVGG